MYLTNAERSSNAKQKSQAKKKLNKHIPTLSVLPPGGKKAYLSLMYFKLPYAFLSPGDRVVSNDATPRLVTHKLTSIWLTVVQLRVLEGTISCSHSLDLFPMLRLATDIPVALHPLGPTALPDASVTTRTARSAAFVCTR